MVGAVVSRTVTVKDAVAVLFAASEAVRSTVVVPIGNVLPEVGSAVTYTVGSTLSVAVAVKFTTAPDEPVASAVMLPGEMITGAVASVGTGTISNGHADLMLRSMRKLNPFNPPPSPTFIVIVFSPGCTVW